MSAPANLDAEKAVLGSILLQDSCLRQNGVLSAEDFSLEGHRRIFRKLAEMSEDGSPIDLVTVHEALTRSGEISAVGGAAYLASLTDGTVPENFQAYVKIVRELAGKRHAVSRLQALADQAGNGTAFGAARAAIELGYSQLVNDLAGYDSGEDWRGAFHTVEDFQNAPELQFAINGFLQESGITLIGGLAGHGKTLIMLSMARALLEGTSLFQWDLFAVSRPATRVLYLIPESSIGPFAARLKLFHLDKHVEAGRLLIRTLSCKETVSLTDPRILKAAEGADVFLDTAVRFMQGAENDVETSRQFANTLFGLQSAGARTITGAHHAPKGFENQRERMSLENILRGSGDIGAMLCCAWGIRQIDAESNRIYVQNVKPRDFQPCGPFVLEGRPYIDQTGHFYMLEPPGTAAEFAEYVAGKGGAPTMPDKENKLRTALEMREKGSSLRQIASALQVSKSTIEKWLKEQDTSVH